jgi:hypothetical protein
MDVTNGTESQADLERKARARRRSWYCLYFIVLGGFFIIIDPDMKFHGTRVYWLGWMLLAFGALGTLGVNIWSGSPEDKRLDRPPPTDEDDEVQR